MSKKSKATSDKAAKPMPPTFPWRVLWGVMAVQTVWLVVAAKSNLDQLNHDAIAYLRIGQYYADGNMALAVSGYWGPLLSWLIAIGIKLGLVPMAAGRAMMVVSALVFQAGCMGFFRGVRLSSWAAITASVITALASIFWSVEYTSPDLLVSGLMLGAWGIAFTACWQQERRWQVIVGVIWGLAYLAKAVAFPLAIGITVVLAGLKILLGVDKKQIGRAAGFTLVAFVVVSLPWIGVISAKYHHPTFSTSGSINHSIVGPADMDRYHPVFTMLHEPEAGRVTQWEEPSRMNYKPWSPFASGAYFQHQVGLVQKNFQTIIGHLANVDLLFVGFLSLVVACYLPTPWKEHLAGDRWRWGVLPLFCLCGIYLPVWVAAFDDRYFYAALPVLLTTSLGIVGWLVGTVDSRAWIKWVGGIVITLTFGFFPFWQAVFSAQGLRHDASMAAKTIARELQQKGLQGPVAGSATFLGSRVGLFTAYYLGEPWLGDKKEAAVSDYAATKAKVLVLLTKDAAATALLQNPDWERLPVDYPEVGAQHIDVPVVVFVRKK